MWLVIELLIKPRKFQINQNKIVQGSLNEHNKEIPKERYICPEDKKSLMILD